MGKRDIQAVYSLNTTEHEAFKMYFEGNTVPQIGAALNMTTSQAGKVLDNARDHVWSGMTEKRVNRGEGFPDAHGSTQETTSETGSSTGQHNLLSVRSTVERPRKGPHNG